MFRHNGLSTPALLAITSLLLITTYACDRDDQAEPHVPLGEAIAQHQAAAKDPSPASEQSEERTAPPAASNGSAVDFTDKSAERFATAFAKVKEINRRYEPKISAAASTAEAYQAQHEAAKEIVSVVGAAGLSVDEYSHIAHLMRKDPQVRERIEKHLGSQ